MPLPLKPPMRIVCAWLLSLALVGAVSSAAAAPPSVGGIADRLASTRAQAVAVQAALDKARADVSASIAKYEQASADLEQTRAQIGESTALLGEIERSLAFSQSQLDQLVIRSYRSDPLGYLDVVLGTTSFEDFVTRVEFLGRIGQRDAQTIAAVRASRDEAQRAQVALESQEASLSALRALAETERIAVQDQMATQQVTLDTLGADIAQLVKDLEQARVAAASGSRWDPNAGGAAWMTAPSLLPGALATIEGRVDQHIIPSGQVTSYRSDGIAWDGVASWYGNAENGTGTSSGRPYNENELTCAHKTLPLGTLLAVSRGDKHVIVVITDRGPFIPGRDIDLSKAAASALGFDGVSPVRAEIVVPSALP